MADPAHVSFLSDIATASKNFGELLNRAGEYAREYQLLGYAPDGADPITVDDFQGNLAGRTPAQALAVVQFVAQIDSLLNEAASEGLSYRQAFLAFGRASR